MTAAEISAAGISEEEHRAQLRRAVIASTVGTTIEWYDFLLYGQVTGLEPVSKVPVVNHRQPGTAFGNRQEPFSLGGSNRSFCPTADLRTSPNKRPPRVEKRPSSARARRLASV
jgi:hypothetical protein